jgi:hypothetical protein
VGPRIQGINSDHTTDLNDKFNFRDIDLFWQPLDGTAYKNAGRIYTAPADVLI